MKYITEESLEVTKKYNSELIPLLEEIKTLENEILKVMEKLDCINDFKN